MAPKRASGRLHPRTMSPVHAVLPALLFALFVSALAASPAHGTPERVTCAKLAAAPRVDSEAARWAQAIWSAVTEAEPDAAPPSLAIIEHPEPGAWLCPPSDKVYLSIRMAGYTFLGRHTDGADLLGFVFAHELAHRRFDPGEHHFTGRCPDTDPTLEALADHRATLLLARATNPFTGRGFSPFQLARRDTLASFFAAELGWAPDCPALSARVDAAHAAVLRLGELSTAYRAALIVSAAGHELGPELLSALSALSPRHGTWDAIPELALIEAAVHLAHASPRGPCPATLPRWSRVAPLDLHGGRAGLSAATSLSRAADALDRARAQRLPESDRLGLELCHALLASRPTQALTIRLQTLGRHEELARITRWATPASAPAPPPPSPSPPDTRPIDPATLIITACGPVLSRFSVGGVTVSRLGECLELAGPTTLRIEPVSLREEHRPLARWAFACNTPSHATDDGVSWWGSGCSRTLRPERWVLETRGARVERAWLVTSP